MSIVFPNIEVQQLVQGALFNLRSEVHAASTANVTIATLATGASIDGVTVVTGDRVLLKNQSTASENGIYVITAVAPSVRAEDLLAASSASNMFVYVDAGTINANTAHICTAVPGADVVGTDNLTFSRTDATGTLSIERGGTNSTSFAGANQVVVTNGTNTALVSTTSPRVSALLDTNGNNSLAITATASAVNYVTITNAATGLSPRISSTGGDANVDLTFETAGTGNFIFDALNASKSAELRLLGSGGTNYIGFTTPASASITSYTLTFPPTAGTSGYVLSTDGTGILSWIPSGAIRDFTIQTNQVTANTTAAQAIAYFPWDASNYTATTFTVIFYANVGANRALTLQVYNETTATVIGTTTVVAATAAGIFTFTVGTIPVADNLLSVRVFKSAAGGVNPLVFGINFLLV